MTGSTDPLSMVRRLLDATNAHDLDGLVSCFAEDYLNETPVHPARGFRGAEQVRRNWTQLFAAIPDLHATVIASATAGSTAWTEWEMSGIRRDGTAHRMRGVIIFNVEDGKAQHAKFYLEPIDESSGDVDSAIAQASRGTSPSTTTL
jgi:ketosteroid isomerase-like protein